MPSAWRAGSQRSENSRPPTGIDSISSRETTVTGACMWRSLQGSVDWHSRTTSANGASYTFCSMPIYEYRCKKGHTFDVMQRFSDEALDSCEVCGAPAQRVLHAPAVHFKGSGFYNTDYGTRKRAREMKEKESSTKSESSSSDSKSSSGETKSSSADASSNGSSKSAGSSAKSPAKTAD